MTAGGRTIVAAGGAVAACALVAACSPAAPGPDGPPRATASGAASPRPPITGHAVWIPASFDYSASEYEMSPGGREVAIEQPSGGLVTYDVATGRLGHIFRAPGDIHRLGFSEDGGKLWAVADRGVVVWDAKLGTMLRGIEIRSRPAALSALFDRSGRRLARISAGGTLTVEDAATLAVVARAARPVTGGLERFSASGDIVITRDRDRQSLWSTETGALLALVEPSPEALRVELSPDARTGVMILESGNLFRFFDVMTGAIRAEHRLAGRAAYQSPMSTTSATPASGQPAQVHFVHWSPDSRLAVVGYDPPDSVYGYYHRDAAASLYETATGKLRAVLTKQTLPSYEGFSADGTRYVASDSYAKPPVRLAWDTATGKATEAVPPRAISISQSWSSPSVTYTATDPDGKSLWSFKIEDAADLAEKNSCVLDPATLEIACLGAVTGDRLARAAPRSGAVTVGGGPCGASKSGYLHLAGEWLFCEDRDSGRVDLRVVPRKSPENAPSWAVGVLSHLAFSGDGERFATCSGTSARVHETATGKELFAPALPDRCSGLWLDQEGRSLLAAANGRVSLFQVGNLTATLNRAGDGGHFHDGKVLLPIPGSKGLVVVEPATGKVERSAPFLSHVEAWSADGARAYGRGELWDVENQRSLGALPEVPPGEAALSRDGKVLAIVDVLRGGLTFFSTETRAVLSRSESAAEGEFLGFSRDGRYVGFELAHGARLVRVRDSRWLTVDFGQVRRGRGAMWALDTGHFDSTEGGPQPVRLFVPGAEGTAAILDGPAPAQAFLRPGVHEDFFAGE